MNRHRSVDIALVGVAAVWGSSYLAAKVAVDSTPVLAVLAARYGLSFLGCAALARGTWPNRTEVRIGGVLGLTQAAVLVLETFGVARTSAANAGLIISLTIMVTPLLDRRASRLPVAFFSAAAVCVAGIGLLVSGAGLHAPTIGDALMLAAALVRGVHVSLVGRLTAGRAIRPLPLTTVQTAVGTVLLGGLAARDLPALAAAPAAGWVAMVYLALACSVFAFVVQTWAVQRTSASRASLLLGTEPLWAVAAGVGLGGEHLTSGAIVGAILVLAGTYWGQTIERRARVTGRPGDDPAVERGRASRAAASECEAHDGHSPAAGTG